jgi:hypothetical protein
LFRWWRRRHPVAVRVRLAHPECDRDRRRLGDHCPHRHGDAGASDDDTPGAFPGSGATNQPDTDPSDFPATAVVTFAGWDTGSKTLQAGGLVSGITDTSGKCTFTATKDGVTRTATSTAQASASSVNCAQVSFPAAKVSSGTWSVTLTYAVGSASTTSDPLTAEVP